MKTIISFIAFVAMCGCAFAQPENNFSVTFPASATALPMQYRSGGSPVIMVKINGSGPFRFIFDTGSPDLLKLDERVFRMLGLPVVDSVVAGDGSGRNAKVFPITQVSNVSVGDFVITNTLAMVRNYNTRQGIDSVDGVIGPVFFAGYLVELNFENNRFIISKGSLATGGQDVQRMRRRKGVPGMTIGLGGKELDAHFDTGNMGGLTLHSSNVQEGDMMGEPRVIGRAQTVSNTFEIREVQLKPALHIGNIIFEQPVVVLNDMLPQASMGIRLLKQMNITLDMQHDLVKLVKIPKKPASGGAG